jgi:hypothetical protein
LQQNERKQYDRPTQQGSRYNGAKGRQSQHPGKVSRGQSKAKFGAGRGAQGTCQTNPGTAQRECQKSGGSKVGEKITTNSSRVASMQPGFFLCLNIFFAFFFKKRFAKCRAWT